MYVIVRLRFELAYLKVTVEHVSHYSTDTSIYLSIYQNLFFIYLFMEHYIIQIDIIRYYSITNSILLKYFDQK